MRKKEQQATQPTKTQISSGHTVDLGIRPVQRYGPNALVALLPDAANPFSKRDPGEAQSNSPICPLEIPVPPNLTISTRSFKVRGTAWSPQQLPPAAEKQACPRSVQCTSSRGVNCATSTVCP